MGGTPARRRTEPCYHFPPLYQEMCMKRFSLVSTLVGAFVLTVAISAQAPQGGGGRGGGGRGGRGGAEPQGGAAPPAQGRGGPQVPTPKNLQFFPKDMTGAQAYDFSDATLFAAANQSLAMNKPDDAIAFAQLNLAYHATSARSYQVMSQAYQRKMDKDKAIQALEKAAEIDPMNQGYKNQLQQLKAGA